MAASQERRQSLQVVQCNLAHCQTTYLEFINQCLQDDIDIALVQEPYVSNVGYARTKEAVVYQRHIPDAEVRAAIFVFNRDLSVICQVEHCTPLIVTIEVKLGTDHLTFCSVYNPPKTDANPLLRRLSLMSSGRDRVIIGGDFNAKHESWRCPSSDANGNNIFAFTASVGFEIMNVGNVATYDTVRAGRRLTSIVDVTLASHHIASKLTDWYVDSNFTPTSDHNAIRFNISMDEEETPVRTSTHKYRSKKADWDKFTSSCEDKMSSSNLSLRLDAISNLAELDQYVSDLTKLIQDACDDSIPIRRRHKKKVKFCPWWSDELEELKTDVIRLKHSLGLIPIIDDIIALNAKKDEYTKAIKDASNRSWKEFTSSRGKEDAWSTVYRILNDTPLPKPPTTMNVNGVITTDAIETSQALLKHFYPDDDTSSDTPGQADARMRSNTNSGCIGPDLPFSEDEVLEALASMRCRKSPGNDHLTADIIKHFGNSYASVLTSLYNKCLELGYFPTPWKCAVVKIIPKPGKESYDDLKAYRPIGLLPVLGKVLEKLFKQRITWTFVRRNKLSSQQFGFTEQTSTSDALRAAINEIKDAKSRGMQVMAVSLDIKAAFDNAWWPALLNQLRQKGCPANIMNLVRHYLQDREVELTYAGEKVFKSMTKGCVQGSVCGPTFWNIILDQIFDLALPNDCYLQAFADDVFLICYHKNANTLKENVEECLEIISKWGVGKKLAFGPEKTQVIGFTQSARKLDISMDGVVLGVSKQIKLLGVIIDQDLSFIKHAFYAVSKAQRIFRALCRMARPTWGLSSEIIRTMYLQAIEPGLTYAADIWRRALHFKKVRKRLDQWQRPFTTRIIKGFHTTSLVSGQALAFIIPIEIRLKELCRIEDVKSTGKSDNLDKRYSYQSRVNYKTLDHPAKRITVKHVDIETPEQASEVEATVETVLYTDGSKLDDKVGSAFVAYRNGVRIHSERQKLANHCSVYQAELLAIKHAVAYAKRSKTPSFAIISDSKSSLQALGLRSNTHPLVHEIHKLLQVLNHTGILWRFAWVRAHIGITGNEAADAEAKLATLSSDEPIFDFFPLTTAKLMIRQDTLEEWNEKYTEADTGSGTRLFLPTIFDAQQLSKNMSPCFETTQVLTGHGFHMQYLHRFKIADANTCPCNDLAVQTILHLIYNCSAFEEERHAFEEHCLSEAVYARNISGVLKHEKLVDAFTTYAKAIVNRLKEFNGTDALPRRRRRNI